MNIQEALDLALLNAPRDPDGNVNADILAKLIADVLDEPDTEAIKLAEAKKAIHRRATPGTTEPVGSLQLFDTYPYEPDRLIKDDAGNVVEQDRAKPAAKFAEARRAQRNLENVARHASRKQEESSRYGEWAPEQLLQGARWEDITFGNFVRSEMVWVEDESVDDLTPLNPDDVV